MFARVGPMKGQADFVESLGRLAGRAHPNLYGVMCGPADKGSRYWRTLEGLVADLGLGERLIIPGDVRPPLKDDIVAASDVVVHPSHAESFGLAVLEAMAAGKPVVAAATDGPRLLIDDGVSGVLVEPGNVEQLTAAVGRLLDDSGARAALGAGAARAARAPRVDDMVRAFEGAVGRRARGRADPLRLGMPRPVRPERRARPLRPERDPPSPSHVAHVPGVELLVLATLHDGIGHPGRSICAVSTAGSGHGLPGEIAQRGDGRADDLGELTFALVTGQVPRHRRGRRGKAVIVGTDRHRSSPVSANQRATASTEARGSSSSSS